MSLLGYLQVSKKSHKAFNSVSSQFFFKSPESKDYFLLLAVGSNVRKGFWIRLWAVRRCVGTQFEGVIGATLDCIRRRLFNPFLLSFSQND